MIIFRGFTEGNKGIYISSLYENEISVLCKIIDGYTGLCSYATPMTLHSGVMYYFNHFVNVFHRRFEVWSADETQLFLKIDTQDDNSPDLSNSDKHNCLKNFKYSNQKDYDAALPLYEIFLHHLYDKQHCNINPEDVVVDIGGHLGFFSYFAICKNASKVYCFEPSEESVKTIRNNFNFPNLILEESAVSANNGMVTFYYRPESTMQSDIFHPELGIGISCKSVNLYDYIIEHNINKINFLKVDCEGSEYDIIKSLPEEYLRNNIDRICMEFHFNTDDRLYQMVEKLRKCGFQVEPEGGGEMVYGELGVFYAWK